MDSQLDTNPHSAFGRRAGFVFTAIIGITALACLTGQTMGIHWELNGNRWVLPLFVFLDLGLYLWRRTRTLGTLLLAGDLGAAIVSGLQVSDFPYLASGLLVILGAIAWVRSPETYASFHGAHRRLPRTRRIWGWVLSGLLSAFLLSSAFSKFTRLPALVTNMDRMHLLVWLDPIAVGSVLASLLFLIPRTASLGALLMFAYWGGAVAAHTNMGDWGTEQTPILQLVILVLVGVATWLRNPAVVIGNPKAAA
jgi:DoxX-like family